MSAPRQILPNRFYMITRRTSQRQLLLRPDRWTTNAFRYCLIVAAQLIGIEVLISVVMGNHHHTVIYDRFGRVCEFCEHLHKLFAKCQNVLRGRWENLWSSSPVSIVHLVDPDDVIARLIYAATNPVKDGLVERAHHWPGVNEIGAFLEQTEIHAARPHFFFRADGPMPKSVSMRLTIPPELGDPETVIRRVREGVAAVETKHKELRMKTGRRVFGRARVLRQSWRDFPTSQEPRRGLNPRVAARCQWARLEALQRNRDFIDAYREARRRWLLGDPIPFPPGTYWLRRFAGVPVAAAI